MKRILILSGASLLLLVGCTKKPNGVFRHKEDFLGNKMTLEFDFRSDGRFLCDFGGEKDSGTWTTQGDAIVATFNGGDKREFKWEGSDLILTKKDNQAIDEPSRFTKQ
jgi:uncharacterized lipoprotein NlpE involved in copper resistance